MAKHKDEKLKEFLIAKRKSTGAGLTNVPIWIIQKKGKRIWNKKQKRNWRQTNLGKEYRKEERKKGNK